MICRSGVTLIEVLVAIFVTSIGLLALLALFPLGAVNMAQAVKDTRTGHSAADAAANIKSWRVPQPNGGYAPIHHDSNVSAAYAGTTPLPPVDPNGPSYAVYVDPIGVESYQLVPGFGTWVGGLPGIRRQTLSFLPGSATRRTTMLRWFTLLDDITFGTDGLPSGSVQRENRYSWAYLLRQPRFSDQSVVEMTIAVYERRPLQLGAGGFVPVGETAYDVLPIDNYPPGVGTGQPFLDVFVDLADPRKLITKVVYLLPKPGQSKPSLRAGGWILDATREEPGHGYFYRVVSVDEPPPGFNFPNAVKLELQENIRTLKFDLRSMKLRPYITQAVVMDNLAEVFEKGPISIP